MEAINFKLCLVLIPVHLNIDVPILCLFLMECNKKLSEIVGRDVIRVFETTGFWDSCKSNNNYN